MKKYYLKQFILLFFLLFAVAIGYYFLQNLFTNNLLIILIIAIPLIIIEVISSRKREKTLTSSEKFKVAKINLFALPLAVFLGIVFSRFMVIFVGKQTTFFSLDFVFMALAIMVGAFIGALIRFKVIVNN